MPIEISPLTIILFLIGIGLTLFYLNTGGARRASRRRNQAHPWRRFR